MLRSVAATFLTIILLGSCAPGSDLAGIFESADLLPPVLYSARQLDERTVEFIFDEPVRCGSEIPGLEPFLEIETCESGGNVLTVQFAESQEIGRQYVMRFSAQDESGNMLSGLYRFSGWNPHIPRTLINELNPRGSKNTPDCVELLVLEDGNIGGLQLLIGTENCCEDKFIFPSVEVTAGEYIVVHTKPEGLNVEIDEITRLDESGGKLALPQARDFWVTSAPGLPGNNGALSLLAREGGEILDAVLYSNREDDPSDEKLGWTSDGFAFASDLAAKRAWSPENGANPEENIAFPSDAVNVEISTATRSICRAPTPADTNTKEDWHVVPTRGVSFGEENTSEVYQP